MIKVLILFALHTGLYEAHLSKQVHPSKAICEARELIVAKVIAEKVVKEEATHADFAVACVTQEEYRTYMRMMKKHNVEVKKNLGVEA